jgi:hypothetical protein
MIKFEHNMLVLNNAFSEADVDEINAYSEHVRTQEGARILELIIDVRKEYAHDPALGLSKLVEYLTEGYVS